MKQTTIEKRFYKGTTDTDYLERVRTLDTAKRVSDIDFQCQNLNGNLKILSGDKEIILDNLSVPEFRKVCSKYVLELVVIHEKEMKDTTTCLNDKVSFIAKIA